MNKRIFKYKNQTYSLDNSLDPSIIVLYALAPRCHDRRISEQVDYDYIDSLYELTKSTNKAKADEAANALIWLNAASDSMYSGSHKKLENLQTVSSEFKKNISNSRNAAQRDLSNQHNHDVDVSKQTTSSTNAIAKMIDESSTYGRKNKSK